MWAALFVLVLLLAAAARAQTTVTTAACLADVGGGGGATTTANNIDVEVRLAVAHERDEQLVSAAVAILLRERLGVRSVRVLRRESPAAAVVAGDAHAALEAWPRLADASPAELALAELKTMPLGLVRSSHW